MNEIIQKQWYGEKILQTLQNLSNKQRREFLKFEIEKRIRNPQFFDRRLYKKNYKFKKLVLQRDGLVCQNCRKALTLKEVVICHRIPVSFFPEFTFELWNGYVGCKECNKKDKYESPKSLNKNMIKAKKLKEGLKKWG